MRKIFVTALLFILLVINTLGQKGWIRINQVGYKEESVKVAVLGLKTDLEIEQFEIVDVLTDEKVYQSDNIKSFNAYACFEKIYRLNFSDFSQRGTYFIQAGDIKSPNFAISDDIYNNAADFLLKYMRQQRCGYNPFLKDSCHTHDGFIVDHPTLDSAFIEVTGGWHDASDYLQYVTTSANATYQMLFSYKQNPESFLDKFDKDGNSGKNGIPDILDEAKWGLDWLNKMNPDSSIMFNQIADDRDHRKFTLPTLDSISYGRGLERPVYFVTGKPQGLAEYKNRTTGVSSTAAKLASAFALGSELLREYYPEFCDSIRKKSLDAYDFAKTDLGVCQTACNVSPYFYEEDNYVDDLELAAVQLFLVTKDKSYLNEAASWGDQEPITTWMGADTAHHYQWYPFTNLGHFLIAKNSSDKRFISYLKNGIEKVYRRGKGNGFLMGVPFIWCSNNLVAALLTQISLYKKLSGDNGYDELETSMLDWLFGCNPWGTSMIVDFPEDGDYPSDPHSALSAVFNMKIDGGLVDGPVYTSIFKRLRGLKIVHGDEYAKFQSDLCVYHDDYGDYSTNEPTMDGTASLTYYLSSLHNISTETNNYSKRFGAIERGDKRTPRIHLVFTGDEYNDGGDLIRDVLREQNVKAHFFFTGRFYRNKDNEKLINDFKGDGHYLGAHSNDHLLYASWENRDSLLVSKQEFINDLKKNYDEMRKFGITKKDAPLFLPPFEWCNEKIAEWTNELGLTLINFSPGTKSNSDYTSPLTDKNYVSSEDIYKSILDCELNSNYGLNGFILLLHVGTNLGRDDKFYYKLNEIISVLREKNYEFDILQQ